MSEDWATNEAESDYHVTGPDENAPPRKKVYKLREMDPVLYNLKKYDYDAVYSRLVQKCEQPLIHTDEEVTLMSHEEREQLMRYRDI